MSKHCRWCKGDHIAMSCHKVKAIEYFANGKVKRVEFHDPAQQLKIITQKYMQLTEPLPPWPAYPFFYPTVTCASRNHESSYSPTIGEHAQ